MKNCKGNPRTRFIEKRNVEKTLFLIGTTTAKTTLRPPVIRKPTILDQVYRDSSGHENQCPYWPREV